MAENNQFSVIEALMNLHKPPTEIENKLIEDIENLKKRVLVLEDFMFKNMSTPIPSCSPNSTSHLLQKLGPG